MEVLVLGAGYVGAVGNADSASVRIGVEGVEAPSLLVRWGRSTLGDVDGLGLLRAAETDLNVARSDPGVVLTRVAAGDDGDDIIGCGG